jgi:hypothetical protein
MFRWQARCFSQQVQVHPDNGVHLAPDGVTGCQALQHASVYPAEPVF